MQFLVFIEVLERLVEVSGLEFLCGAIKDGNGEYLFSRDDDFVDEVFKKLIVSFCGVDGDLCEALVDVPMFASFYTVWILRAWSLFLSGAFPKLEYCSSRP